MSMNYTLPEVVVMLTCPSAFTILSAIVGAMVIALDATIVAAICKHPQMFIKRNYFVLNVTVAELLNCQMSLATWIAHFYGHATAAVTISLFHLTCVFACTRLVLWLFFMFEAVYNPLTTRKRLVVALIVGWIFPVALHAIVIWTKGDDVKYIHAYLAIYIPIVLEILVSVVYVDSLVFISCKEEKTVDDKVRFMYNSLQSVVTISAIWCTLQYGQGLGSIYMMTVEGVKSLGVVVVLTKIDVNFARAFKSVGSPHKNDDTSERIKYDSSEELSD